MSGFGRGSRGWGVALLALLVACSGPTASPPTSIRPSGSGGAVPTPSATTTPAATTGPSSSPAPSPSSTVAAPYDATAVLAAMQASRRPGGVPTQLQTRPIADLLAAGIWTYDGQAWPTLSVSGSCGATVCTVDLSGAPDGGAGEDLYTFSVTPADADVELLVADLHGYPADLDAALDAVARRGVSPDRLTGLALLAARWLPPPDDGQFMLSYRSGGEEGSPALDVLIDLPTGRVLEAKSPAS